MAGPLSPAITSTSPSSISSKKNYLSFFLFLFSLCDVSALSVVADTWSSGAPETCVHMLPPLSLSGGKQPVLRRPWWSLSANPLSCSPSLSCLPQIVSSGPVLALLPVCDKTPWQRLVIKACYQGLLVPGLCSRENKSCLLCSRVPPFSCSSASC